MSQPYPGGALEIEIEIESDLTVPWNDVARFRDDMSDLSDDALLGLVRSGSADAYAVLFERYRHPAHRLAAYFSNSVDAKDIVAECFAQVYDQLRRGKGPQTSFRAYLFTSIRHEGGRRAKMRKRVTPTDVIENIDKPVLFGNGAMDGFERDLVRTAFATLPKRWQTVLWHVDVEGRKPGEVAPMMGLKPNGVSALAYRARSGLKKAYLEQHVTTTDTSLPTVCQDVRRGLVDFVRDSATERDVAVIDSHLDSCATCMGVHLELKEINAHLGVVPAAMALGVAAPTTAGLVSGMATKVVVLAKTAALAAGSTAAVMATTMAVLHMPLELPAGAETIHGQPSTAERQHEPDRTIGPAADRTLEENDPAATSSSSESSTTDDTGSGDSSPGQDQATPGTPSQNPSSGGSQPATIAVNASKVSASVAAAGVKASVSVDLQKPENTRVTVKAGNSSIDTHKVTGQVAGTVKKVVKDVGGR